MSLSATTSATPARPTPFLKSVLRLAMNLFVAVSNVVLTFTLAVVVIISVVQILKHPAFRVLFATLREYPVITPLIAIPVVAAIGLFPRIRYLVGDALVGIWIIGIIDVIAKSSYGPVAQLPQSSWYLALVLTVISSIVLLAPKASKLAREKGWF